MQQAQSIHSNQTIINQEKTEAGYDQETTAVEWKTMIYRVMQMTEMNRRYPAGQAMDLSLQD
jgi:hypothetical protein